MGLKREFEKQGNWLFRWRSYFPLLFLPLMFFSVVGYSYPFGSFQFHKTWGMACIAVSLLGLAVRVGTIAYTPSNTSGRNTKEQVADLLNTTGIYSVIRHPLYLGNYLIVLGAAMAPCVWWLPLIFSLAFWIYYERIMFAEEAFLRRKFGDEFVRWARVTPAFFPRMSGWKKAALPFCWRNALKREYTALLVLVLLHTGLDFAEHLVVDKRVVYEPFWIIFFACGVLVYLTLRTLKRHTGLLDSAGR